MAGEDLIVVETDKGERGGERLIPGWDGAYKICVKANLLYYNLSSNLSTLLPTYQPD